MDEIWDLLKEYDLLVKNEIDSDFVSNLCKKILINPRVCLCGCRFCKICIENYLKNGENICPGSTDECKEEKLNLIENISIDHFINRKITKLKINCPIENCTFSDQIINMEQHLIVCREIAIKCSFSENGCKFISLSGDNVDKHCKINEDKHLELVLSKIKNMKNINNSINKSKIELQQENKKSKARDKKIKRLIKQHKTSSDKWDTIYNQLKAENSTLTKQIADCKSKYEDEINNKNNLMKYLSGYLIGNQTKFIWKINKFSEIKSKEKTVKCDKFFIFKEEIWMQLSLDCCLYRLIVNASHYNKLLNKSCPFICNITVGIVNEITGNFIISFNEKKTFNSNGISFYEETNDDQLEDEVTNDCLTVKCLIKLSSD